MYDHLSDAVVWKICIDTGDWVLVTLGSSLKLTHRSHKPTELCNCHILNSGCLITDSRKLHCNLFPTTGWFKNV